MSLRRADIEDVDAIYAVEIDCFSIPWSKQSIEDDLISEERTLYYVLEDGGEVIGYAGAWMVAGEGQITNVAVKKSFRQDGNGTMLVRKLVRELFRKGMVEVFLEVRISNVAALTLYRRLGFTVKGIRKAYYDNPEEDAYIMSLDKEDWEQ